MDVVNGKIVPARTERSKSDIWRALQPSGVHVRPEVGPTNSMAMNPGPARRIRRPHDTQNILGHPPKPLLQFSGSRSSEPWGDAMDDLGVREPCRAGWSRICVEQDHHQPLVRSSASRSSDPESSHSTCEKETQLQLQLETVGAPRTRRTGSSEGPEGSGAAVEARERRGVELSTVGHDGVTWKAPLRSLLRKELTASDVGALGRIVLPKGLDPAWRRRAKQLLIPFHGRECYEGIDCGSKQLGPVILQLSCVLSVSITRMKDAEGQFPLLETNAKYLEMEEYSFSRRWLFQYKYWVNNKSKMYVLENTGEFVKSHGLKAHDNFIVYKDICGKFVVRGQNK